MKSRNYKRLIKNIPELIKKYMWFLDGKYKNYKPYVRQEKFGYTTGNPEPSAISADLELSPGVPDSFHGYADIFNAYSDFTPEQRYAYLSWLGNMADDVQFQYPFLYFEGLERHITNGNYKEPFELMRWIVYGLDYTEISFYLLSNAYFIFLAYGDKSPLEEIDPSFLNKKDFLTYSCISSVPINTDTLFKLIPGAYKLRNKYPKLFSFYINLYLLNNYGWFAYQLPSFNIEDDINNGQQMLLSNISFDLEKYRTFYIYIPDLLGQWKIDINDIAKYAESMVKKELNGRAHKKDEIWIGQTGFNELKKAGLDLNKYNSLLHLEE